MDQRIAQTRTTAPTAQASEPVLADAPRRASEAPILRFLTCGSVDDGKSTLIGRLLFEANQIFEDTLQSLERESLVHGTTGEAVDFALLVDGLQHDQALPEHGHA